MWLSLVEHLLWEQGVAGSNPVTPTIHNLDMTMFMKPIHFFQKWFFLCLTHLLVLGKVKLEFHRNIDGLGVPFEQAERNGCSTLVPDLDNTSVGKSNDRTNEHTIPLPVVRKWFFIWREEVESFE